MRIRYCRQLVEQRLDGDHVRRRVDLEPRDLRHLDIEGIVQRRDTRLQRRGGIRERGWAQLGHRRVGERVDRLLGHDWRGPVVEHGHQRDGRRLVDGRELHRGSERDGDLLVDDIDRRQLGDWRSLTITTTTCPNATQGQPYTCAIAVTGGTPPYTFAVTTPGTYSPLPEGMALDPNTGVVSSAIVGGEGEYVPQIQVTDAASNTAAVAITFDIAGNNAFLANIFPSSSIFHHRVDAATTSLPVDTSPAAPIPADYQSSSLKVFFGHTAYQNLPNGIPAVSVPAGQAFVPVSTTVYQSYFDAGPIPSYAPVEGTSLSESQGGDGHVLVYLEAGSSTPPALYEMWQGQYLGDDAWTCSSNALWPDVTSNGMLPQGNGSSDAAGLPVAPLLANADEVIGTGTPSTPNGTVQHPIRFTVNHMLNYWVWPGTETAGVSSCTYADGGSIPTQNLLSQSSPPAACGWSGPAGEIYRLQASVPTPSCAATSPQAAILITAFRNYGIIMADNGDTGGLIGTPDDRWNDDDLQCITNLTLSDFEPVNVSSLMVNVNSGQTQ